MKRTPLRRVTPLRKVSHKQQRELARRSRLKKELLRDGPKDGSGRNLCQHCGNLPDFKDGRGELHLSHKIPLSRGGKTEKSNCELLCRVCHSAMHGLREG